jgi:hypothetical protein
MPYKALARTSLLALLVSRGLLFALLVFGSQITFLQKVNAGSVWETRTDFQRERLLPELIRVSMPGDAWWYRSIALHGYGLRADAGGAPNYAFFPLYPLLVRHAGVTGDFTLDGLLLSNLAFAVALFLCGAVAVKAGLSEEEAQRAVVFLAFFPTSYFCSMPLPEALFLALSLGSVLAAYSGRWATASIVGGLAALTRLPRILLFIPLAILLWRNERRRVNGLWLLLVPERKVACHTGMTHPMDCCFRISGRSPGRQLARTALHAIFSYDALAGHVGEGRCDSGPVA